MRDFLDRIKCVREYILQHVPEKYVYLFGSYAYGKPKGKSDLDIYIVAPDSIFNFSKLYTMIMIDLSSRR